MPGAKIMADRSRRSLLHCILVLILTSAYRWEICESQRAPATFVFGDSLVDAGNNNYIFSLSKANMSPNGIDFAAFGGRPSGRYTNGRTIPDIIGEALGLTSFPPPYLAPTTRGTAILKGVNFASGGGGILNETGQIFIGRLSMDAQLDNFANTRQDLISLLGTEGAKQMLRESIFSVTMGSNDFVNNYLLSTSVVQRRLVSPEQFVQHLIQRYSLQLIRLYNLDARKIVVPNVGPIGCIPYERATGVVGDDGCVSLANEMAVTFNSRLKDLIVDLNANLPGATFVYANIYDIVADIIENYSAYGFEVTGTACCGAGRYNGLIPCNPFTGQRACPDHSKYVFWDAYHPSEATNLIIARQLLDGGANVAFPMNVSTLGRI